LSTLCFRATRHNAWPALPIKQIITTDTVPIPPEKLVYLEEQDHYSLGKLSLLGEVIRPRHEGRSVGEMFNE